MAPVKARLWDRPRYEESEFLDRGRCCGSVETPAQAVSIANSHAELML